MRLRFVKDGLIGLALTVVLFCVCEAALWAFGLGGSARPGELSRGFDASASYLVPDPDVPGQFRTEFFDADKQEHVVPPKSERTRVALFGGSNTRGFQEGRLPEAFEALAPGEYEVVNLGRSGYGSARVAIIFEQALELIEPDIVVLYLGHNEFVEAGFQIDLEQAWSSDLARDVGQWMRSLRTVSLVTEALADKRESVQAQPKKWKWEYSKFADLRYDETLAYFDVYAERVAAMCRLARERGVEVVLCSVIYNRFSSPHVWNFLADADAARVAQFEAHLQTARENVPASLLGLLPAEENDRIHAADWKRGDGGDDPGRHGEPLPGRRECFGPFRDQDPLLWNPRRDKQKIGDWYDNLDRYLFTQWTEEQVAGLGRARTELQAAVELFPQHAFALFTLGLVEHALGAEADTIRKYLEDGQRFDCAPRKASELVNDRLRALGQNADVQFFDADAYFAQSMPLGLTGWDWMIDHCHLNVGARIVLMRELARVIVERQ